MRLKRTVQAVLLSGSLLTAGCVSEGPGADLTKFKPLSSKQRHEDTVKIKTQLAVEYIKSGDYRSAVKAIEEAAKADRKNEQVWLVRAQIYQFLKVTEKAEESFREGLKLNPDSAEINNNYGWFLCNMKKNPAAALPHFDKALSDPTYPAPEVAYLNKGICHSRLKRYQEADGFFEQALALNPQFVPVLKERARNRLAEGNIKDADHYFRRYQSLINNLNADDLFLGWRIAREQEQEQAAYEYEAQLRADFPYSDELNKIVTGNINHD